MWPISFGLTFLITFEELQTSYTGGSTKRSVYFLLEVNPLVLVTPHSFVTNVTLVSLTNHTQSQCKTLPLARGCRTWVPTHCVTLYPQISALLNSRSAYRGAPDFTPTAQFHSFRSVRLLTQNSRSLWILMGWKLICIQFPHIALYK